MQTPPPPPVLKVLQDANFMYYDSAICGNVSLNATHGFLEHFGSATDANVRVSVVDKEQVRWNTALW